MIDEPKSQGWEQLEVEHNSRSNNWKVRVINREKLTDEDLERLKEFYNKLREEFEYEVA